MLTTRGVVRYRGLAVAVLTLALSASSRVVSSTSRSSTAAAPSDSFPSFDRTLLLEPAAATSANVSIGDVNGDGHLDIVLVKGRHWPLVDRVLNDGSGRRFHVVRFGDNKGTVYGFALADLDGDGQIDIAAARSEAPNVVYFGKRAR